MKVIDVQVTPNPNARKFVLSAVVSAQPASFFDAASAAGHELATKLFAVEGVASVLLLGDFVTVNKTPEAKWPEVIKGVRRVMEQG